MENLKIELDVNERCIIDVLLCNELKCFKPYTKRCTAKQIPDWYEKRVLSLLKRVAPDEKYVGEVELSFYDPWKLV